MSQIIDSHVHFFPEMLKTSSLTWAEEHVEKLWKICVAPPDRPSIQGWANEKEMLDAMDEANMERVILQGWYWENQTTCSSMNRIYHKLLTQYPDRISAFASLQPLESARALEEIKWILDQGFIGIGELHAQGQGYSLRSECFLKCIEAIKASEIALNFHVTDPSAKDHPGKVETPLNDFIDFANEYPKQKIILSHLGGLLPLYAQDNKLELPKKNVFYDTAAIPLLYDASMITTMTEMVGSDKILFGSDFPLRVFPKKQKHPDFLKSVDFIKKLDLPKSTEDQIFHENAKRLFGL